LSSTIKAYCTIGFDLLDDFVHFVVPVVGSEATRPDPAEDGKWSVVEIVSH